MINIDTEDDMQLIVMATKLLTAWRTVKTRTVSVDIFVVPIIELLLLLSSQNYHYMLLLLMSS